MQILLVAFICAVHYAHGCGLDAQHNHVLDLAGRYMQTKNMFASLTNDVRDVRWISLRLVVHHNYVTDMTCDACRTTTRRVPTIYTNMVKKQVIDINSANSSSRGLGQGCLQSWHGGELRDSALLNKQTNKQHRNLLP